MRISLLVIAHNESARIAECLASLVGQTVQPDEVVVVAHNCADDTAEVARETTQKLAMIAVRVDEYRTEGTGPVFSRIRAFELARNEIVACIDGDSVARPDWLEKLTAPFENPEISGVGGTVRFQNDFFGNLGSFWFFDMDRFFPWRHFYFWGANFACRKSAYFQAGGLESFVEIRKRLGLHFWAEDCFLSLSLEKAGKVVHAPSAVVRAYPGAAPNTVGRGRKQEEDRKKLFRHFGI